VSKLSEPINVMFSSNRTTPSQDDVLNFAKIISNEFEASLVDEALTVSISKVSLPIKLETYISHML